VMHTTSSSLVRRRRTDPAAELARAHVSALVGDARARIGGRIWSIRSRALPVPVELGRRIHPRVR